MKEKDKPIVMFPINANPPTIGHLMALNTILDFAKKVYVIVYDKPQVMPVNISVMMLNKITSRYRNSKKIKIITHPVNFAKVSELPDELTQNKKAYTIVTTSRHIYANLYAKGYPYLIYITKSVGWRDEFHRIAFLRSLALHNVENMKYNKK